MGKTVLLADDNKIVRTTARKILVEAEHLDACYEAEDGLQAVNMARQIRPDLVILDFSMPVMDGLEAARRIHHEFPDLPIILFSLHGEAVFRAKDLEDTGISATVSKAEAATTLVSTVHSLLTLRNAA